MTILSRQVAQWLLLPHPDEGVTWHGDRVPCSSTGEGLRPLARFFAPWAAGKGYASALTALASRNPSAERPTAIASSHFVVETAEVPAATAVRSWPASTSKRPPFSTQSQKNGQKAGGPH